MQFFEKLSELLGDDSLVLVVKKKEDKLFLSITPKLSKDSKKKIVPLTISGTATELDEGFFDAVSKPIQETQGLVTNIKGYEDSMKALEEAKKKEADEKKAKSEEKKSSGSGSAVYGAKKKAKQTPQAMAEGLLKEGDKLFKSKKYKEALEVFESAKTHWAKINLGNRVMDCKVKIKAESELSEETPKPKTVAPKGLSEPEKDSLASPVVSDSPEHGESDPNETDDSDWDGEEPEVNEEATEEEPTVDTSDDDDWN